MWPCDMNENSQTGVHVAFSQHCNSSGEMVIYLIYGESIQAQPERTY